MSDEARNAFECVRLLDHHLNSYVTESIFIPNELRVMARKDAIAHHRDHIIFCGIDQTNLDAYKFVSWYGWGLLNLVVPLEVEKAVKVITTTIFTLDLLLRKESHRKGRGLSLNSKKLLRRMLLNEWNNSSSHGIGKNGLYVAYHCAASPA